MGGRGLRRELPWCRRLNTTSLCGEPAAAVLHVYDMESVRENLVSALSVFSAAFQVWHFQKHPVGSGHRPLACWTGRTAVCAAGKTSLEKPCQALTSCHLRVRGRVVSWIVLPKRNNWNSNAPLLPLTPVPHNLRLFENMAFTVNRLGWNPLKKRGGGLEQRGRHT